MLGASWACHQVIARQPGAHLVTHGRQPRSGGGAGQRELRNGRNGLRADAHARVDGRRIASEGADVVRVDGDSDDAVAAAAEFAAVDPGRALVQDTGWDGYVEVPAWIVEGYETLVAEVDAALGRRPDLVAVPVGVGSLAQAVVTHYRQPDSPTLVLSVEPETAAGILASLTAGAPTSVSTSGTVMAGLNCGTVSESAWPILRDGCDAAIAVPDTAALRASDDLNALGISSGPSGAATLAGVRAALGDPDRRADLDLPDDAVVVVLSTEGRAS